MDMLALTRRVLDLSEMPASEGLYEPVLLKEKKKRNIYNSL